MARPNPMVQATSPSTQTPAPRSGHDGSLQQPLLATLNVLLILSLCYFLRRILCKKDRSADSSPALSPIVVASPVTEPTKNETFGSNTVHDVLSTLPVFVHSAAAAEGGEGDKCTVCLTEFADGEVGRLFPACHHRFHPECISMWLASHSSCPNCRSTVDIDTICHVISLSSH